VFFAFAGVFLWFSRPDDAKIEVISAGERGYPGCEYFSEVLGLYRFVRKVHLWVGLVLAIVLVVEGVTGLILAEPALFGAAKPQGAPGLERQQPGEGQGPGQGLQLRQRERAGGVYGWQRGSTRAG
jgi:hypothetical protein